MDIKTIRVIIDDNGNECRRGDSVFLRTKTTYDELPAVIDRISVNSVIFLVQDPIYGTQTTSATPDTVLNIRKRERR